MRSLSYLGEFRSVLLGGVSKTPIQELHVCEMTENQVMDSTRSAAISPASGLGENSVYVSHAKNKLNSHE